MYGRLLIFLLLDHARAAFGRFLRYAPSSPCVLHRSSKLKCRKNLGRCAVILNLAAYRHMHHADLVAERIKKCSDDGFVLFATAYVSHHGMLDRHNVECHLERYKRTQDVPAYLINYLRGQS